MKVLITGDSHTSKLAIGNKELFLERLQKRAPSNGISISVRPLGPGGAMRGPYFEDRGDYAEILDERYRKGHERLPPADSKFDWIGLAAPLHTVRLWKVRWRHFTPQGLPAKNGFVLSENALRQAIEDDVSFNLKLLDIMKRTTNVFVIEPPWPFRHHRAVAYNGAEKVLFLHRAYRRHVLAALKSRGIPVVEIDPSWVDADGFMSDRFRNERPEDQHHGNNLFGRLMIARTQAMLASHMPARAVAVPARPASTARRVINRLRRLGASVVRRVKAGSSSASRPSS
jgi:hypothetical protein